MARIIRSPWLTAVVPMVWGTTYAITTELLPPGRPLLAATLRALPAGLVLVAATGVLPKGRWWWRSAVLGALNFTVFFAMLFTAAYRLPGGVAATVGAIQPLLVMGLASLALGEGLVPRKLVAGLAGVAGVALLVLGDGATLDGVGVAAGLIGAASMATGSTLIQRWGRPVGGLAFTGWQLTAGGLLLLPIALVGEGLPATVTAANVAGWFYLATVGGVLAYVLWFRGIQMLGAQRATFLSLGSPVMATIVGFVLGDQLTGRQILGGATVLASVAVAQIPARARRSVALDRQAQSPQQVGEAPAVAVR